MVRHCGVALLAYARGFARWGFAASWWAFTFPLDALAYAAARYAQDHPEPLWRGLAGATLLLATFFVVIYAWFAILFTGHYPRGAFEFVEGVLRWSNRVTGYAITMVTDVYPPFRLAA